MTLEPWIERDNRRGTYVVRWRDSDGTKRRDTFIYTKRQDAKDRKDRVRELLVNQSLGKVDLSRSAKEAMEAFLSDMEKIGSGRVDVFRSGVKKFLDMKNNDGHQVIHSMADVTRERILDYMTSLIAAKLSECTVQTYVAGSVRSWLMWCMDHHWLAVNPYDKIRVKTPRKIDRFFTDSELDALEAAIRNEEFLCLFRLGYRSGLRPGEQLRLRSEHVNWDKVANRGELYIPPDEAKTEAGGRYAELPEDVYRLLPKREGLLFPYWSWIRMNRVYNMAKRRSKIEERMVRGRVVQRTFYWTRHTYAKRYLENGGFLKVLSDRMGHASIKVTSDVYGHLERGAIKDIVVPPIRGAMRGNVSGLNQDSAGHMQGGTPQDEQTSPDNGKQFGIV